MNDTGVRAHGFEIELDDICSTDIAGCYSWNHYGTPKISEVTVFVSGTWHTNVFVRYAATKTNGVWAAYTAVPTNSIPPTQGHQFTNPNVNFGGEHFGVGYRRVPSLAQEAPQQATVSTSMAQQRPSRPVRRPGISFSIGLTTASW